MKVRFYPMERTDRHCDSTQGLDCGGFIAVPVKLTKDLADRIQAKWVEIWKENNGAPTVYMEFEV